MRSLARLPIVGAACVLLAGACTASGSELPETATVQTIPGSVHGTTLATLRTSQLLWVQFPTRATGFLLRCEESEGRCPPELAVSRDGGRAWRTVRSGIHFLGLDFVSARAGFAVAPHCREHRCHARLLKTTNGARSFRPVARLPFPVQTAPGGENTSMSFVDELHGWMASIDGLFSTGDGGRTWRKLPFSCAQAYGSVGSTSFVDASTGFVTCEGEPATDMANKALYRSDDGGESWGLVSAAEFDRNVGTLPWIGNGAQIRFLSSKVGFIMAGRYGLARTLDGGRTFRKMLFTDDADDVAGVSFFGPADGYVALFHGQLLHTADGGRHWRVVYPRRPAVPELVRFLSRSAAVGAGTGGFFGDPGAILVSDDAGASWSQAASLRGLDLVDSLVPVTGGGIIAIASSRADHPRHYTQLFMSRDGGRSWKRVPTPSYFVWAVSFLSARVGFTVDGGGRLHRTADGGSSWNELGTRARVGSISFVSPTEGWAVPYREGHPRSRSLLHTADGGHSWQRLTFPTEFQIDTVRFVDDQHGWVVGFFCPNVARRGRSKASATCRPDGSAFLRTTDGGHSWQRIELPWNQLPSRFSFDLDDFVGPRMGLSWVGGGVYETTDGGRTWTAAAP